MKILAFDSSSDILSVGIFDGDKKLALSEEPGFARHSSELAARIERVLRSKKMKLSSLDGIAVGIGPGSFTGLRVGVTAAKVLAFALGKKLVGVPSLEAVARAAKWPDGLISVQLDARRDRVYAAAYKKSGNKLKIVQAPKLFGREDFLKKAARFGAIVDAAVDRPSAVGVARAAMTLFRKGKHIRPENLNPLYLHPKDCNVTPRKENK